MVLIKLSTLFFLFFTSLVARENPFFPMEGEKDIAYTSNTKESIPPLKRATITLPTQARILEKVVIHYKNLDGSQESQELTINNSIDWHLPIFISQNYNINELKTKPYENSYKEVASIQYAKFFTQDKALKIETKDKLLRHFTLVQPHRIIVDFQRDASIKSYKKSNQNSPFRQIRVGNHNGYYRVVIELDGFYKYELQKGDGSYIFQLK